jgi:hypothetical protein
MFRSAATRIITSGAIMTAGLFAVVTAGLSVAPAPAFAGTLCPGPAPVVCVIPSTSVTNHEVLKVIVKTGVANAPIAITECNPAVFTGDSSACNSNAEDFNQPGGPMIMTGNAAGKAVFEYKVLVSATKDVGDGLCAPGGSTCAIVAANAQTEEPYANPVPFETQ